MKGIRNKYLQVFFYVFLFVRYPARRNDRFLENIETYFTAQIIGNFSLLQVTRTQITSFCNWCKIKY